LAIDIDARDPLKIARKLWKETRVNEERIEPNATPQRADRTLKLQTGDTKGANARMTAATAAIMLIQG
jgi:hypothetical protein